jgi:16S rRNA (adenine1518-N6/adenine1519-N6)-dimethyltransferase
LRAKKSYGQHFLASDVLAEKIVNSLKNTSGYHFILEVGPGKGVLTKHLLKRPETLVAVEADEDMVTYLRKLYPDLAEHLVLFDFLKFNPIKQFDNQPFGLIGNFPYNISSQILLRMVKFRDSVPEMVGMFQKEVADRIIAPPGSKTYGVLSLLVQAFYRGTLLFNVERGSFVPPPKVRSAVIRLERKEEALGCDYALFKQVVKTTFNQRRKMLRNTLRSMLKGYEGLNSSFFEQRPEQLSLEDFVGLTNLVSDHKKI